MVLKLSLVVVAAAVLIYAIRWYSNGPLCESNARMDGKVIIVTGGNTGIGKETVKDLVERGGKVYLCSRSIERGQTAADDIKKITGVRDDRLIVMQLDLGSTKSIRKFTADFLKRETRLDVLINNAGVMMIPEGKTDDGFETTFGVNHLGHFLLTTLLTDILIQSKPSRVVTVSSLALEFTNMKWDDIMHEENYNSMMAYAQSKLANALFSRELSHRLKDHGVTTYVLHPGSIPTELQRHIKDGGIVGWLWIFMEYATSIFHKDIPHGAATQICCAVDENLATVSGKYFKDVREAVPYNAEAESDEAALRLWKLSVQLLKLQAGDLHPSLR